MNSVPLDKLTRTNCRLRTKLADAVPVAAHRDPSMQISASLTLIYSITWPMLASVSAIGT